MIGASWYDEIPGARIIGEVCLEQGEKITVALGQTGNYDGCGHGGTFVVRDDGGFALGWSRSAGLMVLGVFHQNSESYTKVC